ncbi:MAG: MGMT family protein [Candidatus Blackburnbacteria bacterium]|nr:MGMT family protein [Candidatus Blackburnbacteria bacterium]
MSRLSNAQLIYKILPYIPGGKVATYGQLGRLSGVKSPRVVGNILHKNPDAPGVPCHRVVTQDGRMGSNYALGGPRAQEKRLQKEGVEIINGRVNLAKHLWSSSKPLYLYIYLLSLWGPPGPWPWFGNGPAHTPEEIAIGAILTQNTNWKNVEKVLCSLKADGTCTIDGICKLGAKNYIRLKELIRPSGYYNQKAKRLFEFCKFIVEEHKTLKNFLARKNAREELLALYGIGPETADAILLYAGNRPVFVVDAYTKRFAKHYDLTKETSYQGLQNFLIENLPKDTKLFQDYHALIVKWGKDNKHLHS